MTRITTIAEEACEDLTRVVVVLAERLHAMDDAMQGQPKAQSFDTTRTGRTTLWCWTHHSEVHACHRDGMNCDGETIDINDPTGEAAVSNDRARHDREQVEHKVHHIRKVVAELVDVLERYGDRKLVLDRAGVGYCSDCHRYCDGEKRRLILHRSKDLLCDMCRKRRERAA